MHAVIYMDLLNGGNFHRKLFKLIYILTSYQFSNLLRAPNKAKTMTKKRHTRRKAIHKTAKRWLYLSRRRKKKITIWFDSNFRPFLFMVKYIYWRCCFVNLVYFYETLWKMMNIKRFYCSLIQDWLWKNITVYKKHCIPVAIRGNYFAESTSIYNNLLLMIFLFRWLKSIVCIICWYCTWLQLNNFWVIKLSQQI